MGICCGTISRPCHVRDRRSPKRELRLTRETFGHDSVRGQETRAQPIV